MNEVTIQDVKPAPKPIKLNKKQNLCMQYWTDPTSETFANIYQSGIKAGFAPTYSRNMTHLAPKWLSTYIDRMEMHPEHITQGVQRIATTIPNSKSPDDTRLKAYEMLARFKGMMHDKNTTNITLVQPILSGASVTRTQVDNTATERPSTP